jgi:hypothetical protein
MFKLTIRGPRELLDQLRAAAEADERSLNGEILWLLRLALAAR